MHVNSESCVEKENLSMEAALLLAKLPEAYSILDPLVDVLPLIPLFFLLLALFGKRLLALDKLGLNAELTLNTWKQDRHRLPCYFFQMNCSTNFNETDCEGYFSSPTTARAN